MSTLILGRRGGPKSRSIGFVARQQRESSELVTYSGDGHLITFAPTGTGKTSGPVITNALKHPGQLIVLDMKGEVFAATAEARRAMGQEVCVLDLRDDGVPGSLNPLDLAVSCGTDIAAVARSFAAELIERGSDERDRFWNDWAETMIAGGCAWLMADCPPRKPQAQRAVRPLRGRRCHLQHGQAPRRKKSGEPFGQSGFRLIPAALR